MQRRTTALAAAALSLLPLGQSLLLGTLGITTATTAVVLHQGAAFAQDSSAVARIAKAITVRIEGSTQGSGVIVKREGNRYTVLTAWHVVRSNRPGEEVGIYTPDGKEHQLEQGSIQRLGQVDMAVLTFSSPAAYEVASVGDVKSVSMGNQIFVSGFPVPTSAVPTRLMRFEGGMVKANATVAIPDGYQLLYSNQTLPGMSGGSVLNSQGRLVGIHGRSERDDQVSMSSGKAVSTGTNQAVPISYYRQFNTGQTVVAANTQATSADDYLAQATSILSKGISRDSKNKSVFLKIIQLSDSALAQRPNSDLAYAYRARVKVSIGKPQEAIADANKSISLNPRNKSAYYALGNAKDVLKDYQGAIADYGKAIAIDPEFAFAYANRGVTKSNLKDYQGAIADYNKAIALDPQHVNAYINRGLVKKVLKDYQGAIADCNKAIAINPQESTAYALRGAIKNILKDYQGAIADYSKAIAINPQYALAYTYRGIAKDNLKDYQGAIADYSKAIAINPQHANAYNNRAAAKKSGGDIKGACSDIKKAVSLGHSSAKQYLNDEDRAWCRNMR